VAKKRSAYKRAAARAGTPDPPSPPPSPPVNIVAGAAAAVSRRYTPTTAAKLQKAMSDAVTKALADGVDLNDSVTIKARMKAAFDAERAKVS
jgi:hypothetical protein